MLATGYSEMNDQISDLGAQGFIQKPFGLEEIEEALANFASG